MARGAIKRNFPAASRFRTVSAKGARSGFPRLELGICRQAQQRRMVSLRRWEDSAPTFPWAEPSCRL